MCEVMRSPTIDMSSHPLRLRQPNQTTLRPLLRSPPMTKRSIPSADMFARDSKRAEPVADIENQPTGPVSPREGMLKLKGPLTMEATTTTTTTRNAKTTTKLPVVLSVYCTPFDKYVVISQERVMCKDCGYVNLKNCVVRRADKNGFQITTCDGEKRPLVFYAKNEEEAESWVSVLEQCTDVTSKPMAVPKPCSSGFLSCSPRSHNKPLLSLTALSEEEEEEESEE